MNQPIKTRRLAERLLIGAAVLALPLTATMSYAGDETAPPTKGETRSVYKVVIVNAPDGATIDDKNLYTRTVERNGKTIVLKTRAPLTDAEAEERIAKAEAEMPQAPMPPITPAVPVHDIMAHGASHGVVTHEHGPADEAAAAKGERREVHTMVIRHGDASADAAMAHGEHMAMTTCKDGNPVSSETVTDKDGKKVKSRVVICSKGGDKATSLSALRSARQRVADDPAIPAEAKGQVLKQLDERIALVEKGA